MGFDFSNLGRTLRGATPASSLPIPRQVPDLDPFASRVSSTYGPPAPVTRNPFAGQRSAGVARTLEATLEAENRAKLRALDAYQTRNEARRKAASAPPAKAPAKKADDPTAGIDADAWYDSMEAASDLDSDLARQARARWQVNKQLVQQGIINNDDLVADAVDIFRANAGSGGGRNLAAGPQSFAFGDYQPGMAITDPAVLRQMVDNARADPTSTLPDPTGGYLTPQQRLQYASLVPTIANYLGDIDHDPDPMRRYATQQLRAALPLYLILQGKLGKNKSKSLRTSSSFTPADDSDSGSGSSSDSDDPFAEIFGS